ncbi:MAG: hypothetical protein R3C17_08615 [Planctomycetaceae bacterium]
MTLLSDEPFPYPQNMQDPAPTAPDDVHSPNYPTTSFEYPARTVFRFDWTDPLWLLYLKAVAYAFAVGQMFAWFLSDPLPSTLNEGTTLTILLACGLFGVCIALFGSGFVPKIYAAVTAIVGGFLSFALGSWIFQAMMTLCFLWFFLDRFILHGIDARATIPRTLAEQTTIREALRNRWRLRMWQPIGIQHTLLPLFVLFSLAAFFRHTMVDTNKQPDVEGPLVMILFFLLAPFVVDIFAPIRGGTYIGPSQILSEFGKVCLSWLLYDRVKTTNPAIHRSPVGNPATRTLIALSAALTIFPVATPRHFYRLELDPNGLERRRQIERDSYESDLIMSNDNPDLSRKLTEDHQQAKKTHWDDIAAEEEARKEREAEIRLENDLDPALRKFMGNDLKLKFLTARPQQSREDRLRRLQQESEQRRKRINSLTHDSRLHAPSQGISGTQLSALREMPTILRIAISLLLPLLMPVAFTFFATARLFAGFTARGFPLPSEKSFTSQNWNKITGALHTCDNGKFRHDIFWGVNTADNGPVIVPSKVLREHVHFLGDSGSGKTSLGISPLLAQLMQFGDASVIVIDLKADDQTLFEVMREGARINSGLPENTPVDSAEWSYPFRYFTPIEGRASHGFNPFSQRAFRKQSALQKTDLLTAALGLQYGTDYGRKYFGDSNFSLLQAALQRSHQVPSFAGLKHLLKDKAALGLPKKTIDDGANVVTSVERLAAIEPLNRSPDGNDPSNHTAGLIDLADLFEKPQAAFFALPAGTGSLMSAEMARLVLFSLMNAAQRAPKPRRQVYVIMDEFQRAVSGNIEVLLQMARSHDVSLILANQCLDDLRSPGADIASTVTNNTRIRQIFGVSTPDDLRDLTYVSGERLIFPESKSISEVPGVFGIVRSIVSTLKPTPTPKLRVNDLIEASDHPNRSIFSLKRGEGLAQFQGYPFIMESCYHISPAEYERRRNLDWPTEIASTIWKRKTPTAPPTPVEFNGKDDAVAETITDKPPELLFTKLPESESAAETVGDGDVSETTEEQSLITKENAPPDSADVELPPVFPEESPAAKDDVVWDGDRPIPPNQPAAKTARAAEVDPQALKDMLKTLDDFNL